MTNSGHAAVRRPSLFSRTSLMLGTGQLSVSSTDTGRSSFQTLFNIVYLDIKTPLKPVILTQDLF